MPCLVMHVYPNAISVLGCLQQSGRLAEAFPMLEEVLETRTRVLGARHEDVFTSVADVASCLKVRMHVHPPACPHLACPGLCNTHWAALTLPMLLAAGAGQAE